MSTEATISKQIQKESNRNYKPVITILEAKAWIKQKHQTHFTNKAMHATKIHTTSYLKIEGPGLENSKLLDSSNPASRNTQNESRSNQENPQTQNRETLKKPTNKQENQQHCRDWNPTTLQNPRQKNTSLKEQRKG